MRLLSCILSCRHCWLGVPTYFIIKRSYDLRCRQAKILFSGKVHIWNNPVWSIASCMYSNVIWRAQLDRVHHVDARRCCLFPINRIWINLSVPSTQWDEPWMVRMPAKLFDPIIDEDFGHLYQEYCCYRCSSFRQTHKFESRFRERFDKN